MHATSLENLQKCVDRYIEDNFFADARRLVIDLGAADINGSYRPIFQDFDCDYLGFDLQPGPGVDRVLDDPYHIPLSDNSAHIVISGQTFEHCEFFWEAFKEMTRVVSADGFIFLIAPSAGPIHRYPVDCYRFLPDAYHALARYAGCHVIDLWQDERGPWKDLTGIFSKDGTKTRQPNTRTRFRTQNAPPVCGDEAAEQIRGEISTLQFLQSLHQWVKPRSYLEIGVRHGASVALATCPATAIDPEPDVTRQLGKNVTLLEQTSDDFFEFNAASTLSLPLDLVFLDGMHLFEFTLRDFMNIERYAHRGTIVVIDDIFPNHPAQASRRRSSRVWTGDVWKIARCFNEYRPDLGLIPVDTKPAGLMLVVGLNPKDQRLWANYNQIVGKFNYSNEVDVPDAVIKREGAHAPDSPAVSRLVREIANARRSIPPTLISSLMKDLK